MRNRPLIVSVLAAGGLAVSLPLLVAGQTPNQPGQPTLARVHILNRDRAEAVPVKVQNTGDSLPVVVVGEPTVSLAASAVVAARATRQVWEYRRIVVGAGEDPTAALNTAGAEGWEAVGGMAAGTTAMWLLKRPK